MEPYHKGGLSHSKTKIHTGEQVISRDPVAITDDVEEEISQTHLDRLVSVQLIRDHFDGSQPVEKLAYILEDG